MHKINKRNIETEVEKGFSARQTAKSCDIAQSTVTDYLDRAKLNEFTFEGIDDL
jgi:transposase